MRELSDIPDLELFWRERAARVRRSRSRSAPVGMTRPPRDPVERAFLAARGALGPFVEAPRAGTSPASARDEPQAE